MQMAGVLYLRNPPLAKQQSRLEIIKTDGMSGCDGTTIPTRGHDPHTISRRGGRK